ncbi:hypothetical protein TNCV_2952801 [Trichonephila clavipes]|nr:hypothetical protein TNCV_2952801 [Trichonephila clavipes]
MGGIGFKSQFHLGRTILNNAAILDLQGIDLAAKNLENACGYPRMYLLLKLPWTNHNSATPTNQDIPAETVSKNNSDSVTTPPCHDRPTNQDTLSQAGPITSGHIYNLDMGWMFPRDAQHLRILLSPTNMEHRKVTCSKFSLLASNTTIAER